MLLTISLRYLKGEQIIVEGGLGRVAIIIFARIYRVVVCIGMKHGGGLGRISAYREPEGWVG
jgi:hypothetical protein